MIIEGATGGRSKKKGQEQKKNSAKNQKKKGMATFAQILLVIIGIVLALVLVAFVAYGNTKVMSTGAEIAKTFGNWIANIIPGKHLIPSLPFVGR